MKQVFYVPERGDVIWISASRRTSRSPGGRRAVVVLSPQTYNGRVGLAVVCPLTSCVTGYPFEVPVPADLPIAGVVLADQAASLDWRALRAEKACALPNATVEAALGKLRALLSGPGLPSNTPPCGPEPAHANSDSLKNNP